jgi:hypothetical protein
MNTPIALFAYNRPAHLRLALRALERCDRLSECRVFIFCDGPKNGEEVQAVGAVRGIAREWSLRHSATVIERQDNAGLAVSIVSGVTELCSKFGRTIVIEDDLVVSRDFLSYMIHSLDKYDDEHGIFQVSGYLPPIQSHLHPDVLLLPLTTTWGWATWERAWRFFDWNATGWTEQAPEETRHQFDLGGSYPYSQMLDSRLALKNDSWGILWWWSVFKAHGLVVYPRQSLVWVGGFDDSGTHCGSSAFPQAAIESFSSKRLSESIQFPIEVNIDEAVFENVKNWLRQLAQPPETPATVRPPRDRAGRLLSHFLKKIFIS